jgi:hypothetical protein
MSLAARRRESRLGARHLARGIQKVKRFLATAFSAALGTAAVIVGIWGAWLLIDPAEERHYEWAIPMLVFAFVGAVAAVIIYRRT